MQHVEKGVQLQNVLSQQSELKNAESEQDFMISQNTFGADLSTLSQIDSRKHLQSIKNDASTLSAFQNMSKEELKSLSKMHEDEIIKLKKQYKEKLDRDTTGMTAESISELRADLGLIMNQIEDRSKELFKLRKLIRN